MKIHIPRSQAVRLAMWLRSLGSTDGLTDEDRELLDTLKHETDELDDEQFELWGAEWRPGYRLERTE